ncbi:uncharacterized protein LOC113136227 [Mastacembelus armatus]|uniref:uncharacterized protein LOC113136227 n=1 Tax=Mastacembelus armatus TaxID=205130 RepID=UPI000E461A41|nr:uncharacterized protein LOC113136227 [Mastacembelus armatus]
MTMTAKELLEETLKELSSEELDEFKSHISLEKDFCFIPIHQWRKMNIQDMVELMVEMKQQQSVKLTKRVLWKISRIDLLLRLLDISSEIKEKHFVDKQGPSWSQRVDQMVFVIELLLETIGDLSDKELEKFQQLSHFHKPSFNYTWSLPLTEEIDLHDTVFLMVKTYGQESVRKTKHILGRMKRTDLTQRLSDITSEPKKKLSVDEHLSALFHKVATMASVRELLLETLSDLRQQEFKKFKWFLQFPCFHKGLTQIPWRQLEWAEREETVDLMVEMFGQLSVEVTMEVFMHMNRTDLAQRLSETSSELKGAESSTETFLGITKEKETEEHHSVLTQKVETMVSVIELLLETLAGLRDEELKEFMMFLRHIHHQKPNSDILWRLLTMSDVQDTVFLLVQTYDQQSVEKTKEILEKMKRRDLLEKLSLSSSGPKKKLSKAEQSSALIQIVAKMAAVKQLLLETLNNLSYSELMKFKEWTASQWLPPDITWILTHTNDREEIVDVIMQIFGQQSMEVTRKVLMDMDLVERLSKTSLSLEEQHSVGEPGPPPMDRVASWDSVKQTLLQTLRYLNHKNLMKFQWLLQFMYFQRGLPQIPWYQLEWINTAELLVNRIVKRHGQQSVEVTREIFKDMNRTDLEEKLLQTSSEGEGPSRSLELVSCGSTMQDCSDWTKLEPEVNKADADETPTYSLQSGAGNFECSVSGLRWVCKNQVGFKYQFYSWEEHVERMESIQYMPAGPLIDIRVIAGKFDEVYLPHWIFIDDNPTVLDKFAVLHIDDCGDVVEKVSEVTSSHVKLPEPIFSLRGVLLKLGLLQKIKCRVLIYKTTKAFLTLHAYQIPSDPGLEQAIEKREVSDGSKAIRKPHPARFLQMHQCSILTADLDGAEICPEDLELRYENSSPNYFEIFVEKPDRDFTLRLKQNSEPVWTCVIRQGDYQRTGHIQGKHFVDRHKVELIRRVSNIGPILDDLLDEDVIQQEVYEQIRALPTTQDKIRELYSGPLKASEACKDIFYESLQIHEKFLIDDLKDK